MNMVCSYLPLFVFSIVIHLLLIHHQNTVIATDYSNDVSLITKSCSGTKVPSVCTSILEADPRSKAATNLKWLSRVGIDILCEKANETISIFKKAAESETDPSLKQNLEFCGRIFGDCSYVVQHEGIPYFESGDYKSAKMEIYTCCVTASDCQDTGIKLFSKEVQTLYNFTADMTNFMDMLSSK
ncbi:hypothetical protein ACOSP7_008880 [Xanthoceras sorbifolium]